MVPVLLTGVYETRLVLCRAEIGPGFEHRFDMSLSFVCSSQLRVGRCQDDVGLQEVVQKLKRLLAPRQCGLVISDQIVAVCEIAGGVVVPGLVSTESPGLGRCRYRFLGLATDRETEGQEVVGVGSVRVDFDRAAGLLSSLVGTPLHAVGRRHCDQGSVVAGVEPVGLFGCDESPFPGVGILGPPSEGSKV